MASPLASLLAQAGASGTSPQPFRATVAPTDVEKAYSDYNNAMEQAYQAKIAQQNAMWGGLAQLGGAAILGAGGLGGIAKGIKGLGLGAGLMGGGSPTGYGA